MAAPAVRRDRLRHRPFKDDQRGTDPNVECVQFPHKSRIDSNHKLTPRQRLPVCPHRFRHQPLEDEQPHTDRI